MLSLLLIGCSNILSQSELRNGKLKPELCWNDHAQDLPLNAHSDLRKRQQTGSILSAAFFACVNRTTQADVFYTSVRALTVIF